jgi:hypothetical protein
MGITDNLDNEAPTALYRYETYKKMMQLALAGSLEFTSDNDLAYTHDGRAKNNVQLNGMAAWIDYAVYCDLGNDQ